MQRIYLSDTTLRDELIISDKELYHQITRVMRARTWQSFIFFDGKNLLDYVYEIEDINKKEVRFVLQEKREKKSEIPQNLELYQALPNKLAKLEYIVQKCCEVGYKKIIFFESDYSQKLVLSDNKKERLQKIAIEATEQCGGNILPKIEVLQPHFSLWELGQGFSIFCHTKNNHSKQLSEINFSSEKNIRIFVWPEWGWSLEEVKNFEEKGFYKVNFGERILRCETVWEVLWFYISQQ